MSDYFGYMFLYFISLALVVFVVTTLLRLDGLEHTHIQTPQLMDINGWHCSKVNGQNPDKDVCVQFTKGE